MIRVHNTLSGKKEPLPRRRPLRLFVCGPTVYNLIHIGNARTYLNFDFIVRWLRHRKVKVVYLQNLTDIDDKIIRRAAEERTDWKTISKRYTQEYFKYIKRLGIASVDIYAPATKFIKDIERQVATLKRRGYAYEIPDDGIYFDIAKFKNYGSLARRTVEQAEDGVSRIDASERKRNRGDFCLWKFSKLGEPVWQSTLGPGRPGWHIEDTAITEHYFGVQYEMHGGARDLIFPHHEAEIAQQEAASGKKPFVKVWVHAGFLTESGTKMSKSLGNFMRIDEALKVFSPEAFRMMCILHHYRAPMEITDEVHSQAEKNLSDFRNALLRLEFAARKGRGGAALPVAKARKAFNAAMDDDFNSPQALGVLFSFLAENNLRLWKASRKSLSEASSFLRQSLGVWGFSFPATALPSKLTRLAEKREVFRRNKQFMHADDLRKQIEGLGYSIEDTPLGPLLLPRGT